MSFGALDILGALKLDTLFARRVPSWAPLTFYRAGELVVQANLLYAAKVDFTSAATFDATNWNAVGGGGSGGASATDPLALGYVRTVRGHMGSAAASGGSNVAKYVRAEGGATITKIGLIVSTSSGNIDVGAYSNTGTAASAAPGTRIASAGSTPCPAVGYAEVTVASSVVNQGDWLAWSADNATVQVKCAVQGATGAGKAICYQQGTAFPLPGSAAAVGSLTVSDNLSGLWGWP